MHPRAVVPLVASLLLVPTVAFAGPPSETEAAAETESAVQSEPPEPELEPEAPGDPQPSDPPPAGADPATAAPGMEPQPEPQPAVDPPPAAEPQPATEPALPTLLESDEPEAPRPRVAPSTDNRERVDQRERLRSYYASVYRPKSNPTRVYFAVRGAYSLTGSSQQTGGGRMGFFAAEVGQTWNYVGYGVAATLMAGGLTFGDNGVEKASTVLVGGGPSLSLGRLALIGRGYLDLRAGYNFFYAPVIANQVGIADPPDAAPHGPKLQLDLGLLLHDSERRRFRHGFGATIGWQMLVHSLTGEFPLLNSFNVGISYFFG